MINEESYRLIQNEVTDFFESVSENHDTLLREIHWLEESEDLANGTDTISVELEGYSPAGEDLVETITFDGTLEDFCDKLTELYELFDPDEHVRAIMDMNDAPGICALAHDAERIDAEYKRMQEVFHRERSVYLQKNNETVARRLNQFLSDASDGSPLLKVSDIQHKGYQTVLNDTVANDYAVGLTARIAGLPFRIVQSVEIINDDECDCQSLSSEINNLFFSYGNFPCRMAEELHAWVEKIEGMSEEAVKEKFGCDKPKNNVLEQAESDFWCDVRFLPRKLADHSMAIAEKQAEERVRQEFEEREQQEQSQSKGRGR